ncbi:uncharacterized protein [Clytia hemisphaerica]|uniref:uncharacterized protein isoform X1 n=1 Tax=Clytia hemisphaerica TaxID=252671 RepID=UPI0034D6E891
MSKFINSCGVVPFEKSACSLTTDSSVSAVASSKPIHKEIWFILTLSIILTFITLIIIVMIIWVRRRCHHRKEPTGGASMLKSEDNEPKMNKEDKQHELVQDDPRTAYPMGAPPAYSEKSNGGELDNTKNERHEVVSPLKMLDSWSNKVIYNINSSNRFSFPAS